MSEESANKNYGDDAQEQREKAFQSLSTPLIDISHMSVNNSSQEEVDKANKQKPDELLFAPLHRDGHQARLVEEVRRRQRQQYEETSYTQWFWELFYEYGPAGIIDDPRNNNQSIHYRSTNNNLQIQNPYRDNTRSTLNNNKGQSNNASHTTTESTKKVYQSVYYPDISKLSKYPRIIRFICVCLVRCLYMFRWCIDFCITKLSCHIKPLQPNPPFPTYSSSPVYDLHITADNIISLLVVLLVIFYYSSKMKSIMSPTVVMMCLTICFVCWKVVDRVQQVHESPSWRKQSQQQQQQQTHANTTAVPKQSIPNNMSTTQQDEHAKTKERLQKQYPGATHAECQRFYKCVNYKEEAASKRLDKFLKWRSECGLKNALDKEDTTTQQQSAFNEKKDELDWEECSKLAISIMTKSHISESGVASLPQIICSYENHETTSNKKNDDTSAPRCKDGTRILHILPFRLDLSIATAPTYSLAAALYLDRRLSRSSLEFITLFVDVRGGRGWSNPTPWSTLPFIQSTASLLGSHYPERLSKLVLVPMPKSSIWIWSAAQKCLDPNTASKVVVVSSSGDGSSGLPDKLNKFISKESLIILEKRRRSFFVG